MARRTLAVLGGTPAFAEALHVGRPNVADKQRFLERAGDIVESRWLTNHGPLVQEFEKRIADFVGVKHCIAVCNATIGLELTARAAGLQGEVIVPSYTFIATAHSLQWQAITPVFADIDERTHGLDPSSVEKKITARTTGIVGTHLWGAPCDIDALTAIAKDRRLVLMFDAAHAFGCSYRGRMIGGFGLAEVFSFHATKFLNAFEGGAVTTNDDQLAARIRLMKNFGFAGYDNVIYVGTNGKMTEICAAMGLTNLERIDDLIEINRRNYSSYRAQLADLRGLALHPHQADERCNHQYIVMLVDENLCALTRDELVETLHAENILARRYFWPGCHRMEPYRTIDPLAGSGLPVTERIAARVIVLPTGSAVDEDTIERLCGVLRDALKSAAPVRARLAARRP